MSDMNHDERMAANEVVFREHNKKIIEVIKRKADIIKGNEPFLQFFCECSSPFCMEQVNIDVEAYEAAHKDDRHFIIKPGHLQQEIEKVVQERKDYDVVEKYKTPPSPERIKAE